MSKPNNSGILSDSFMDDNMFDTSVDLSSDHFAKPKKEYNTFKSDMLDWKITDLLAKSSPAKKPTTVRKIVKAAVAASKSATADKQPRPQTPKKVAYQQPSTPKKMPPKDHIAFKSRDFIGTSTPIKAHSGTQAPLNISEHEVLKNVSAINKKYIGEEPSYTGQKSVSFTKQLSVDKSPAIKTPEQVFAESLHRDMSGMFSSMIEKTDEVEKHLVEQYEVHIDQLLYNVLDEYAMKIQNRDIYAPKPIRFD